MVKIINPSYKILTPVNRDEIYRTIENAARTCYQSKHLVKDDGSSAVNLVKMLVKNGHWAMIEHAPLLSVQFICNRGFTHEIVRHRLASFAQESTRYCNYSKDGFGKEITVICPPGIPFCEEIGLIKNPEKGEHYDLIFYTWRNAMEQAETFYMALINRHNASPQIARGVLPIDVKTDIVVTANLREWYHIFKMRCAPDAHPSMHQLMRPLCTELKEKLPELYESITW